MTTRRTRKPRKGSDAHARSAALAAMGMEAEFAVVLNGQAVRPEDVFGSPTRIVRAPMMHRTGRSYHLPTGGALYFDTGVVEIATPIIEIEPGCSEIGRASCRERVLTGV